MMSPEAQRAHDTAQAYDKNLRADDPRFRSYVKIRHEDGSLFFLQYAFLMIWQDEWLLVFTEHHGVFVFHLSEVNEYAQYLRVGPVENLVEPVERL
jgi:hypothetical protein